MHTSEIFGKPGFNYTYRKAVIEGFLVDHDAPHNIVTKLSKEGINYKKGETVAIYDSITGEITNSSGLEDELKFDVDKFNRKVITENFNRTVLEEIANDLNPDGYKEITDETIVQKVLNEPQQLDLDDVESA